MAKFTPDAHVWEYARENGFVIVTADSDFISFLKQLRAPPKVVHLEKCNYKTRFVEELLRRHAVRIAELEHSDRDRLIIRNAK